MALCSTGCMSMGGSDAPRSINCELGVPGTSTICLNAPTVRSLAGVPAGAISLCNFYGKSSCTPFVLDYLLIAGGGGGAPTQTYNAGGGGGAGGILCGTSTQLCPGISYSILIGGGGTGKTCGSPSCIGSLVTTTGGGGGGIYRGDTTGQSGGSGGGAGQSGGSGGCAVNNCAEGNKGYDGVPPSGGGGGGGKCQAGSNYPRAGQGGTFCLNQLFALGELCNGCYYVGGGGASGYNCIFGGLGGGGNKGNFPGPFDSCPGCANMGGGGGAGIYGKTGVTSGGSGAAFIRYPCAYKAATVTGCVLGCCVGGYRAFFFCGSGTFCLLP